MSNTFLTILAVTFGHKRIIIIIIIIKIFKEIFKDFSQYADNILHTVHSYPSCVVPFLMSCSANGYSIVVHSFINSIEP